MKIFDSKSTLLILSLNLMFLIARSAVLNKNKQPVNEYDGEDEDEDYNDDYELAEKSTTKNTNLINKETKFNILESIDQQQLNEYRKLYVNDLRIVIEDLELNREVIKVYLKDDVQFECNVPNKFHKGTFDWSINNQLLGINDTTYVLAFDKEYEKSTVNIKCHFQLISDQTGSLEFPSIQIGKFLFISVHSNSRLCLKIFFFSKDKYIFDSKMTRIDYLKFKYQKQILILNISAVVAIILGIAVLSVALINRNMQNSRNSKHAYTLANDQQI